jgi:catechol 2,3-dioxygenase-like lactoylglutathione lyase family enzyme
VFDHLTIRASDRSASERFYDVVLPVVGLETSYSDEHFAEWGDYSLVQATPDSPATTRLHIAFFAPSRDVVDEFWRAGMDAGYRSDGGPGLRPEYSDDYYGAFLLDPGKVERFGKTRIPRLTGGSSHRRLRCRSVPGP